MTKQKVEEDGKWGFGVEFAVGKYGPDFLEQIILKRMENIREYQKKGKGVRITGCKIYDDKLTRGRFIVFTGDLVDRVDKRRGVVDGEEDEVDKG